MYTPPPDRKRASPAIWAVIAALGGCGCLFMVAILAAILFPVFAVARAKARQTACLSNVRQLSTALLVYSSDYDDHMPAAENWMDLVSNNVMGPTVYHCPQVSSGPDTYGYAYYSSLSNIDVSKLTGAPRDQILVFDSTDLSRNASGTDTLLPMPGRHTGRNIIGYLDGHSAAVRP